MSGFFEFMRAMGSARLGAMGAVAAILIGVFAVIILRVTAPVMTPLYTELTFEDSSQIISELESLGIPFEIRKDGSAILIPKADVLRTRMRLAEQGLPTGGSIGYEIFDRSETLGATSFVQNINHLRALEGELARTIQAIRKVVTARVHLVIPERQLFQRDKQDPTASIVLKVRGQLEQGQVRAVQHLVASAVEGLSPSYVSIIDETGQLLATGMEGDSEGMLATSLQERTVAVERRLRQQVEEIVSSVVGPGRARVRIAAEIDYNRITQTSETYDPDGQVVRSTQTREESASSQSAENGVTAGNQLPNAQANQGTNGDRDASSTTEETVNYEISRSTKTEVVEAGGIRRLSIAVLIDGVYESNADGDLVYTPRTQDDLDRISALVRSAVGFSQARGDQIEVVNLRFAKAPTIDLPENSNGLFDFTKDDILYFIELGVLLLIALLLMLFVVRPLVRKILTPEVTKELASAEGRDQALIADDGSLIPVAGAGAGESETANKEVRTVQWLNDAQAAGAVHAKSVQQIGEIIDEYPNEAVSIIRGWLNEAA